MRASVELASIELASVELACPPGDRPGITLGQGGHQATRRSRNVVRKGWQLNLSVECSYTYFPYGLPNLCRTINTANLLAVAVIVDGTKALIV